MDLLCCPACPINTCTQPCCTCCCCRQHGLPGSASGALPGRAAACLWDLHNLPTHGSPLYQEAPASTARSGTPLCIRDLVASTASSAHPLFPEAPAPTSPSGLTPDLAACAIPATTAARSSSYSYLQEPTQTAGYASSTSSYRLITRRSCQQGLERSSGLCRYL